MFNPEVVFPIFFGTWVVLGIASIFMFFVNKNAAQKRKVWPPFVIGVGVLFAFFIYLMGFPVEVFAIFGPAIFIITILNLRTVVFCDSCGKTIMNQNPFSKPEYCQKCGSKLNA